VRQIQNPKFEIRNGPGAIFLVALVLCLLAAPGPSEGQQPAKVYRIGYLGVSTGGFETDPQQCLIQGHPNWQAWVEGLRAQGYLPGQNLVLECRWMMGREERAPALAAELVALKPDLIVAVTSANVLAAKQATSTIPIVMVSVTDPVGRGLVASLARPGGNVTGLADAVGVMLGKHLQLLTEVVPKVSRVAVLSYVSSVPSPGSRGVEEAAAQALGVTLQRYEVRAPEEFAGAFAGMTTARAEALLTEPWAFMWVHRQRIVELAAQSRLPAMYHNRGLVDAGGLMSYAVNEPDCFRRLGFYVDKILKGAKPADLPVEQPTKFELVINLKTAKALGLTIPRSLLSRADEVIQ
jgi:putative ABC transport system substrate-binding protein